MDTRTLFEEACAAAPLNSEGAKALEQVRAEAEGPLNDARAARDAATKRQGALVGIQFKINLQLARLNDELASAQPVAAKGIIDAVDAAGPKADLVAAIRTCTRKRQDLAESIAALNYALDFLVRQSLPEAGIKATEASIQYTRAKRDWIACDANVRLHALRCSLSDVLKHDPDVVLSMDQHSLAASFVRALAECDVEANALTEKRDALVKHVRELNGGLNG